MYPETIEWYVAVPLSLILTLAFIVVVLRQRKLERDHAGLALTDDEINHLEKNNLLATRDEIEKNNLLATRDEIDKNPPTSAHYMVREADGSIRAYNNENFTAKFEKENN